MDKKTNIVLIGMPAVGKSTVGILLAKKTGLSFLDTDILIQTGEGKLLSEIIEERGCKGFMALEQEYLCSVGVTGHVIATGGSAVYSGQGMEHLAKNGVVAYLETGLDHLKKRLSSLDSRGVIRGPGQDISALYHERTPLYERYANLTVQCGSMTPDKVLSAMMTFNELPRAKECEDE
jgi:shikimate kinase